MPSNATLSRPSLRKSPSPLAHIQLSLPLPLPSRADCCSSNQRLAEQRALPSNMGSAAPPPSASSIPFLRSNLSRMPKSKWRAGSCCAVRPLPPPPPSPPSSPPPRPPPLTPFPYPSPPPARPSQNRAPNLPSSPSFHSTPVLASSSPRAPNNTPGLARILKPNSALATKALLTRTALKNPNMAAPPLDDPSQAPPRNPPHLRHHLNPPVMCALTPLSATPPPDHRLLRMANTAATHQTSLSLAPDPAYSWTLIHSGYGVGPPLTGVEGRRRGGGDEESCGD